MHLFVINRRGNLKPAPRGPNNHEWSFREKRVNTTQPRGVVWVNDDKQEFVRASLWWTTKDGRRKQVRSKKQWPVANASEAHQEYLRLKEKHYRHRKFAAGGKALPLPKFPPSRKEAPRVFVESLEATF